MKLQAGPLYRIKEGKKTVEVRLYDEKRRLINVGDEIEFALVTDENEKLHAKVLDLIRARTFAELFEMLPPTVFGKEHKANPQDMYQYYTKEQEEQYGVVGIKIEVMRDDARL
jgi:ASC-1-like (ASCH) protein